MRTPAHILRPALLAVLTLATLLAAALLALAPAAAEPPPSDLSIKLTVDDADGVIQPGQRFELTAELTYTGPRDPLDPDQLHVGGARIWTNSNAFDWESGGSQLKLNDFSVNEAQTIASFTPIELTDENRNTLGNQAWAWIRAMDGRTALISRSVANNPPGLGTRVFVYDLLNRRQSITINPPPGADNGWPGFGHSQVANGPGGRNHNGTAVAVWHENEAVAWIFVGSHNDTRHGNAATGSVYVFRLDWTTNPPTYELRATLFPSEADACNTSETSCQARFGTALTISPDGRALAVGADRINQEMGAVYVYMRPESEGGWGDVRHENAIKVTPVATPPWGSSFTTAPFTYTSTGRTGASTDCDAYCSRAFAADGAELGKRQLRFSRNAEVLLVAAQEKDFASNTPGGGFSNPIVDTGEAYVFVAPGGDWAAHAHDATVDAQGNPKTLIGAKQDARDFDPDTHYSPGPRLRVTEPTAVLVRRPWTDALNTLNNSWFGHTLDLTLDGRTVAVGTGWDFSSPTNNPGRNTVAIYQLEADETWEQLGTDNPNGLTPDAQFVQNNHWMFPSQIGFSADGQALLMGNPTYGGARDPGVVFMQRRPATGRWAGGTANAGLTDGNGIWWEQPGPNRGIDHSSFAYFAFSLDRQRLSLNSLGYRAYDLPNHFIDGHGVRYNRVIGSGRSYLSDERCTTWPADRDGSVVSVTTCRLAFPGASAVVPLAAAHGAFRISAELTNIRLGDDADAAVRSLQSELELEIGTVKEVAETRFGFGVNTRDTTSTADDTPWPASIGIGESTGLRLQILTERGLPSATGSVTSVVASATAGTLRSNIGASPGCTGGAGAVCRLDVSALTGDNTDNILFTLTHGGTAATANVDVRVVGKAGETLNSEVVTVTLTGPPASLSIGSPVTGLLNVDTPDSGADQDDRDQLTLPVTAADQAGATVAVPTTGSQRAWLTDPDGKRVTGGVELSWPLLNSAGQPLLDAAGNRQVRIDIDRAAAQPLANGRHTLSVRAGALTAEQTITVSGGPAAVALTPQRVEAARESEFTVTASLTDAEGAAVPNGTPVRWSELVAGGVAGIVQRSAERITTNGQASATWLAIRPGRFTLTATAGDVTAVTLVDVPAPPPPSPAEMLTSTTPGAYTIWTGTEPILASDLLPAITGVTTISFFHNGDWLRYGVAAGQLLSGSQDFPINPGDVLWLSNNPS